MQHDPEQPDGHWLRPPFLPFLNGPPDFGPNLSPIAVEDWLLPDSEASRWLQGKRDLMNFNLAEVAGGALDGPAALELLHLIWFELPDLRLPDHGTALERVGWMVSDDICLLERDEGGIWRLAAGILCAPTYWRLRDRLGQSLAGLHGPIPGGDPGLARRIDRVFSGLRPGMVLQRFNWTVQAGPDHHTPERPTVDGKQPDDLHLRVERQTLRRLPQSGAVVFTIRVSLDPLLPVLKDTDFREAFEDAWLKAAEPVRRYKGWAALEPLVAQACREAARRPAATG